MGCHHTVNDIVAETRHRKISPKLKVMKRLLFTVKSVSVLKAYAVIAAVIPAVIPAAERTCSVEKKVVIKAK